MTMGLAMFFGLAISQRLGERRTVVLSLLVIGLATASRLFLDSALELILSAVLAGIGIALIQALMPTLIKSRFSDNVALCMGLYVTSIMGGAAIAASFAPLVMVRTGSWRLGLAIWAVLAVVALLFWCSQRTGAPTPGSTSNRSFFSHPRAWLLAAFFGLGTASYTCVLAWLAPYYVEKGWSEQNAGLLLGFLTAMEVLSGLLTPAIANRSRDRRLVLVVLLALIMAGFCGLILSPGNLEPAVAMPVGAGNRRTVPDEPDRVAGSSGRAPARGWAHGVRARHWLSDRRPFTAGCRDDPRSARQFRMGLVVTHRGHGTDDPDGLALRSTALRQTHALTRSPPRMPAEHSPVAFITLGSFAQVCA